MSNWHDEALWLLLCTASRAASVHFLGARFKVMARQAISTCRRFEEEEQAELAIWREADNDHKTTSYALGGRYS